MWPCGGFVLSIATSLQTNLHQQTVVMHSHMFLNPKLHARLVLEKWAWHIRAFLQPCINLQPYVSE